MPLREAPRPVAPASRRLLGRHPAFRLLLLPVLVYPSLLLSPLAAKTRPSPALDPSYVTALAAADRVLQAWQSGDIENGTVLLTSDAKEKATADVVEKFFSNPGPSAYEIDRGKLLKGGRYEFPVVLVTISKNNHTRRRFSSIIVVNTGNNDWAVDKLP
jgi:hypothetical protein